MEFCVMLTKAMDDRGLTAYKIWKETGISQALIGKWKSGQSVPSMENLNKIANYLGVSADYLLGTEKNPAENKLDEVRAEIMANAEKLSDADLERLLEYAKLMLAAEKNSR